MRAADEEPQQSKVCGGWMKPFYQLKSGYFFQIKSQH
jgi:hypothetical protein